VGKILKQLDKIIEVTQTALVENIPLEPSRATQNCKHRYKTMQLLASKDDENITLHRYSIIPNADSIKKAAITAINKNETDNIHQDMALMY